MASDPANVTMKNGAKHALTHLFVVDRRGVAGRFAHVPELAADASAKIEFRDLNAPAAGKAVLAALKDAGLTESEAAALFVVWKPQFLESAGLTAFYILPQAEYDRMLPLVVTPKPAETVRVGVVLHPRLEGEPAILAQARSWSPRWTTTTSSAARPPRRRWPTWAPPPSRSCARPPTPPRARRSSPAASRSLENFDASVYLERAPKK